MVNYEQNWLRSFVPPESVLIESHDRQGSSGQITRSKDGLLSLSEDFYDRAKSDLLLINQERKDLLNRLEGLDPTLSADQIGKLRFAKWLFENGRISG